MGDQGSSVTLIFYAIDSNWWNGTEPFLNLLAAAAQFSTFTHVEMAIGEDAGARGQMSNVLRIFNDSTGAELTERTGKNPNYQYVQVGCSKKAELAMLHFARMQVGKPFSSTGMARSLIWPRESDHQSWYCAELIAACLQHGGLMSRDSKPGAATPHSMYKMYKSQGAMQANPYTLRQQFGMNAKTMQSLRSSIPLSSTPARAVKTVIAQPLALGMQSIVSRNGATSSKERDRSRQRSDSPPRMQFRVIQARGSSSEPRNATNISLSLASLNMNRPH
jgi:hypothetical protein